MYIEYTQNAICKIKEQFGNISIQCKLIMDTEGCGCSLDGVPALWLIDHAEPADQAATSSSFPTYFLPHQAFLFDSLLKIDVHPERACFVLSSSQQIYHSCLPIQDHRSRDFRSF